MIYKITHENAPEQYVTSLESALDTVQAVYDEMDATWGDGDEWVGGNEREWKPVSRIDPL